MPHSKQSTELVQVHSGEPVTTTIVLADGVGKDHASIIKLVRTYQSDLEEFGLLDFKSESTGGRPTEFALLNEQQSTLLITYMRNTDVVRAFKKKLVREFFRMRRELQKIAIQQSNPDWKYIRDDTKSGNQMVCDTLKEIREELGKDTESHHYSNEQKMMNWAITGKFEALKRDSLSAEELKTLVKIQRKNTVLIAKGMEYSERKKAIRLLADSLRIKTLAAPEALQLSA